PRRGEGQAGSDGLMAETREVDGIFIDVEVDDSVRSDAALSAKLAEVCPVDIFAADGEGGSLRIVRENLDECVLCELCLDAAPDGRRWPGRASPWSCSRGSSPFSARRSPRCQSTSYVSSSAACY